MTEIIEHLYLLEEMRDGEFQRRLYRHKDISGFQSCHFAEYLWYLGAGILHWSIDHSGHSTFGYVIDYCRSKFLHRHSCHRWTECIY